MSADAMIDVRIFEEGEKRCKRKSLKASDRKKKECDAGDERAVSLEMGEGVNRAQEALVKRDWVGDVGKKVCWDGGPWYIFKRWILLLLMYVVVHW